MEVHQEIYRRASKKLNYSLSLDDMGLANMEDQLAEEVAAAEAAAFEGEPGVPVIGPLVKSFSLRRGASGWSGRMSGRAGSGLGSVEENSDSGSASEARRSGHRRRRCRLATLVATTSSTMDSP